MKMTKKNVSIIVLMIALIAGIFTAGSAWAFFSDNEEETNAITLQAVDTEIEEEIDSTTMQKEPTVLNSGTSDCIVRMKVVVTPESEISNIEFTGLNTEDWVLAEDGYYYYQGVIAPGESTSELFTHVNVIDLDIMNEFEVMLYQEGIQTEIIDNDGNRISVLENGEYSQENANALWSLYQAQ